MPPSGLGSMITNGLAEEKTPPELSDKKGGGLGDEKEKGIYYGCEREPRNLQIKEPGDNKPDNTTFNDLATDAVPGEAKKNQIKDTFNVTFRQVEVGK